MSITVLSLGLLALPAAHSFIFMPADRNVSLFDCWVIKNPITGFWNMQYLAKAHVKDPYGWNAIGGALSTDGVHFADTGLFLQSEVAAGTYVGSGSIWTRRDADGQGNGTTFVVNYSNFSQCDPPGDCQTIYFSESHDPNLLQWSAPVSAFHYDPRHYHTMPSQSGAPARWDCLAVVSKTPSEGRGYYGYFTATPLNTTGQFCDACGAGFAQSEDGVTWEALSTPGPDFPGEVGGVARHGDTVIMLFDNGYAHTAPSPRGPFQRALVNPRPMSGSGMFFPRIWGSDATGSADTMLFTHHQGVGSALGTQQFAFGLVKKASVDSQGVLRAMWWENNDALKGRPRDQYLSLYSGVWIDGSVSVPAPRRHDNDHNTSGQGLDVLGLWIPCADGDAGYVLGLVTGGAQGGSWVQFAFGGFDSVSAINASAIGLIDRGNFLGNFSTAQDVPVRLLVRTMRTGTTVAEFYAQDNFGAVSSLPCEASADGIQTLGGAKIHGQFYMTLPEERDSLEHPIAKAELLENIENKLLTLNRLMTLLTESIEKMPLQQHRLNIELNEKAAKMQRKQR